MKGLPRQPRSHCRLDSKLVGRGYMFDAMVVIVGCDKNPFPPGPSALARLNVPGLLLYGGSIAPGRFQDKDVTIQDVFEAIGANAPQGRMSDTDLKHIEDFALSGSREPVADSIQPTPWPPSWKFIGLSPMGTASVPATDGRKDTVAVECGQRVMDLLNKNIRPLDILTRQAFENAIACVAATGGFNQRGITFTGNGAGRPAFRSILTISIRSVAAPRSSPTSNPVENTWRRMWTEPAVSN